MTLRKKSRHLKSTQEIQNRFANVNGARLHFLVAGKGDPVVLLHGYAETSHMWLPLMPKLATSHTVIAVDLRGAGQSSTPADGYTKAAMARDVHALTQKLGYDRIRIVGHDIGLMVAYAFAAQYPKRSGSNRFDGRVPAGRGPMARRLADARSVAFPFLR